MRTDHGLVNPNYEYEIDILKWFQILRRRWIWIASMSCLTTVVTALAITTKEPTYQANAQLLFEANPTSSLIGLDGASREIKALSFQDDPLDTQVQIIRSVPIVQQVIDQLQIKNSDGELLKPSKFRENLEVEGIPGTDILRVSYTSPDAELAAAVVNTIMDVYIHNDVQVNRAAAEAAQQFILEQLPETESAVAKTETELSAFKELNGIVDLEEEAETTVDVLARLDESLTNVNAAFAESEAKALEMRERLRLSPQEAYTIGLLNESPGVQEALSQLQTIESELSIERARYQENHPAISNLRRQERQVTGLLQQRINETLQSDTSTLPGDDLQTGELEQDLIAEYLRLADELSGLAQKSSELSEAQKIQRDRAQLIPGLEKRQRQLERKLNAAQVTYETLLQNLQEARVLENQNLGNSRVVSPALIPELPVNPASPLYIAAGSVMGILLGVSVAFLADLLDRSAKTVCEGQEFYEYPLLGVIPAWKNKIRHGRKSNNIPTVLASGSEAVPIMESYQALQSNLKFATQNRALKTIAVTSSVSGEGKSEVVANLAWTFSQLGHKVLIVDANMRKPIQHYIWSISNQAGFSDVIAGHSLLEEVIVQHESLLHVLPVGSVPHNPVALLESQQTQQLLEQCQMLYDYIIVDTPAVSGLTDTLILGQRTDGILLVMQPSLVDIDSINSTKVKLAQSHQNVLGLVANGIKAYNNPDKYYYYNQEYFMTSNFINASGVSSTMSNGMSSSSAS